MDGGLHVCTWMSLHPARGGSRPRETGTTPGAAWKSVAEFLNRPTARFLSGQKTPWSVVQAQDFFRIGERVCEGQGFNDRRTDRQTEKEKFLLQIEISMEEYFSLPFSPSPPSSLLLQLDKQPVATHLFEAKILKIWKKVSNKLVVWIFQKRKIYIEKIEYFLICCYSTLKKE